MIVDSSALVAILGSEPEGGNATRLLRAAEDPQMSAATYVELGAVVARLRDPVVSRQADELIRLLGIRIVPVDESQARIARAAYQDCGQGMGTAAQLNCGDTFSYALASATGKPPALYRRGFQLDRCSQDGLGASTRLAVEGPERLIAGRQ